jgi:phosphatidylglycerophosphate synthase
MRKLDACYENPVDDVLLKIAEPLCAILKKLNFTPNGITTLSLIFGLLSVYALYIGKVYMFGVLYLLSYFFDCVDGHYARKYDMITEFGDFYDHVKDFLVFSSIIAVFIMRNKEKAWNKMVAVLIILFILYVLMMAHLGCQEKIYDSTESVSLHACRYACPGDAKTTIQFTKYFGCGTFTLVAILLIIYVEKTSRDTE